MRIACLLLISTVPLSGGCSSLIACAGQDSSAWGTKTEVRAKMGEPVANGVENGVAFDEYHTRRKISEVGTMEMSGRGMGFVMTFGASELIAFPRELYWLGSRTLFGRNLRFTYDAAENVTGVFLDGEQLIWLTDNRPFWMSRPRHSSETAASGLPAEGSNSPADLPSLP